MKRVWIGLVNTYDVKRLHEIHVRTIARAAPLCYAYGLNLLLVGFPLDRDEVMKINTTIGHSGLYLNKLMRENRFLMLHDHDKFPAQLGYIISTTSHPQNEKRIGINDLKCLMMDKNVTLLVGLGRKGLPAKIIDRTNYHLELTGKDIPLETCTVFGVIAYMVDTLQREDSPEASEDNL